MKVNIHVIPPHPVYKPGDPHYRFGAFLGKFTATGASESAALDALAESLEHAARTVRDRAKAGAR